MTSEPLSDPPEASTSKQSPQAIITTIPRVGHLVWVGPHRPPQEMMESWVKMNPKIMWSIWKDHTAQAGWENQAQIDSRAARDEWNGVADVIRYELLYRYGGICVDADSTCVRPLDEGDFFAQEKAIACYENELVRPGMIGCGFLGAPRAHGFFRACIDEAKGQPAHEAAWKTVGPLLMGRVAARLPDAIRIYPARMFNPKHYTGQVAPGDAPIFAEQGWGSTKGYNSLRKLPCQCPKCWVSALRPPWG
jgi:mannosyltransferase OCH1-like enzyme